MGLDVSSGVVVGVHLVRHTENIKITKYNEDTGEPYESFKERKSWRIDGTDIEVDYGDGEYGSSLDIHHADCNDEDSRFFGIQPVQTRSHRHGKLWAEIPNLDSEKRHVTDLLKKNFGYEGNVGIYVLTHLSY